MRTRGGRAVPPSSVIIVAFWIVAIVSTVVAFAVWLISRVISVDTEITEELQAKVVEIVNKRPVHRTLESSAVVVMSVDTRSEAEPRAVPVARMGRFREMHYSTDWAQIVRRSEGVPRLSFVHHVDHLDAGKDRCSAGHRQPLVAVNAWEWKR